MVMLKLILLLTKLGTPLCLGRVDMLDPGRSVFTLMLFADFLFYGYIMESKCLIVNNFFHFLVWAQ